MNLELDDTQRELLAVTNGACGTFAQQWLADGPTDDLDSLKALADIGILGARHPEPLGTGLTPVEAVLAAQVCGAALAPTAPMVWGDLLGSFVPESITGEQSITGTFDPDSGFSYGGVTTAFVWMTADAAYLIDSSAVSWRSLPRLDPKTPRAIPRGGIPSGSVAIAHAEMVGQWRHQFYVLVAAHLVGVGTGAVDRSVAYAKERQQFGRPIGSFQAVKHLLADAYTAVEMARSQVLTAALCWAEEHPAAPEQATAAAVVAARAALQAAQTAIQVHGGMGFTAEATPHLYYKRALQLQDDLRAAGLAAESLLHRDITLQGAGTP